MSGEFKVYLRHEVEFEGVYVAETPEEAVRSALADAREEWSDSVSDTPLEDMFCDVEETDQE